MSQASSRRRLSPKPSRERIDIRAERPSWATSAAVRSVMVANRKKDTRPELRLRAALHGLGLRYRVHVKPIPGVVADVVFRPTRVVVFVDGCFWHGCEIHGTWPAVNSRYWTAKISGNVRRDRRVDEVLVGAGWRPIRVWEHEPASAAARRIFDVVRPLQRTKPRGL